MTCPDTGLFIIMYGVVSMLIGFFWGLRVGRSS